MLEDIFSVKNEINRHTVYKVMKIFGIKIKFINIKKTLYNMAESLAQLAFQQGGGAKLHENLINLLIESHSPSELFCMRTDSQMWIISKEFFKQDRQFVFDFLNHIYNPKLLKMYPLNPDCQLYQEHMEKVEQDEIVWIYTNNGFEIHNTFVRINAKGKLEICKKRTGTMDCPYYEYIEGYKKEFIKGTSLKDYLSVRTYEEKKEVLEKYYEYVFNNYITPETGKFPGYFFDANPTNIIVNDEGFHLIDIASKSKAANECDKNYIIYISTYYANNDLYHYFIEKYNLEDNGKEYDDYMQNNEKFFNKYRTAPPEDNKKLVDKYFSDRAFMPEYKL